MNQHADMLIFLLALKHGETSFAAGLQQIPPFLQQHRPRPGRGLA